jgi:hypothetical protein
MLSGFPKYTLGQSTLFFLVNKADSVLLGLNIIAQSLDQYIYLSFIRPVIEYADIVWDNCTLHESNLLESVQVEAGRIITGLRINSSKTKLYVEFGCELLQKDKFSLRQVVHSTD